MFWGGTGETESLNHEKDTQSGYLTAIFYLMRAARRDRIKAVVCSVAGRYRAWAWAETADVIADRDDPRRSLRFPGGVLQ